MWQRGKETYSVSFSPVFACEWIHVGHWSCFLLARLSSWIYVNWPCLRQPLKDISLLESEGRQGCRPSWASSCVCVWERECVCVCVGILRPPDWAQSLRFKFQRCACLLTHVDLFQLLFLCRRGYVMCISVYMHVYYCSICLCVHGSLWWGGEPNATLSLSSSFSFSKSSERGQWWTEAMFPFDLMDWRNKNKQTNKQRTNQACFHQQGCVRHRRWQV